MAPRKAPAAKDATVSKPKANTGAKITKPTAKGKTQTKATTAAKAAPKKEQTSSTSASKKAAPKKATTKTSAEKTAATAKKAAAPKKEANTSKKTPAPEKAATAASKAGTKRKATEEASEAPVKKAKVLKKGPVINEPPTQRLNVYVFGEGSAGELGLGTSKKAVDVKRPRLNPHLAADSVGVVAIEAGGMHVVALTHDNRILTWGVNDDGALGRDTRWEGGLKDMDAGEDSDSDSETDDNGINPKECIPGEVDWSQIELPEGTRFTSVAAGDSTSFAITDDGHVYGWGTFRTNEGPFGFTDKVTNAYRPMLIEGLSKITAVKTGDNHALALDTNGAVFAWGNGQQLQLGRKVVERTKKGGLTPREFGLPKGRKANRIVSIGTGSYHNFALSKNGEVWTWGLNNFGETGITTDAGEDGAVIGQPQVVESLRGKNITEVQGGAHHSIAITAEGDCLAWGRADGSAMGIAMEDLAKLGEDTVVLNEQGKPGIVLTPQKVTALQGTAVAVASGPEHNLVVTDAGKAWSWGFSANYQTGLGTEDDVAVATLVDNTAVREVKLTGATAGGQFGILFSAAHA